MLQIKEVEMVDSMEELKSSRSVAGNNFKNFEILDAKIASALNKIILNSHFKKKVSLEEQKAQEDDQFLRGRLIAYMIYDYFRVTGVHDTVLDYADSFSVTLRNDNVQEFDTRWDEKILSVTKIPQAEILYPKACPKQAAADSRGSRTCVCENTLLESKVAHAGREGRINVLPWYRQVGVAKTSRETQRRKSRAARKGKWPPRGTGMTGTSKA